MIAIGVAAVAGFGGVSGAVPGIALPGGSTGGLAADLTVTIDLSGKD